MEGCLQAQVQAFIAAWTEGSAAVAYTPQGLARAGSGGQLRNAANAALLAMVHARRSSGFYSIRLACWARSQVADMPNTMPCEPCLQILYQLYRLPPQAWRSTCSQHLPVTTAPELTRQQWVV